MSLFTKLAAAIFAPTDAGGNARKIVPHDAQVWGTELERAINAFISSGGLVYAERADLYADLDHPEHTGAWVVADPVDANNGIYGKVGGTGTGSWVRRTGLPVGEQGPPGPAGADGDITWEGPWVTATAYTTNQATENGGSSYVCIQNHTSSAANEPGVGASWTTYWDLMAAKGGDGLDGDAATIGVGNVTTLNPGDPATVTNVGTSAAAIFNFGIPRGQDGAGTGDMTKAVYDPGNINGNAFNGFPVTSRADLKLLDTAQFSAVYLLEEGRQGNFLWTAGDYSAQITADTQEGIYVASAADPTGAAGAWVRKTEAVTPAMYGGVVYATADLAAAGTDSSAAVQAALRSGFPVMFHSYYRCDSAVSVANMHLSAFGLGAAGLVFTNTTGGGITITQNSQAFLVRLSGFNIITNQQEPGQGLVVDYSGGGGGGAGDMSQHRNQHTLILERVQVRGLDYLSHGWTRGIYMDEVQSPILRDVYVVGRRDEGAAGELRWWPGMTEGIYFTSTTDGSPVDPLFDSVEVRYAQYAFRSLGVLEGMRFANCVVVASRDGIYDDRREVIGADTTDPWLSVHHCHFNTARFGVRSFWCYQGFINDNLLYRFQQVDLAYQGISLETGNDWQIHNNHINGANNVGLVSPSTGIKLNQNNRSKVSRNQMEFCDTPGEITDTAGGITDSRLRDNEARNASGMQKFWTYNGTASEYSNPEVNYVGIIAEGSNTGDGDTVVSTVTTLATVSLSGDPDGSVYKVYAQAEIQKGGTAGTSRFILGKTAGTATFAAGVDATFIDTQNDSQAANSTWRPQLVGIFRKTSAGTLSVSIQATSGGSNGTVPDGSFQYVIERVR